MGVAALADKGNRPRGQQSPRPPNREHPAASDHGVDRMLERGEIDFVVLSYWHLDHYWGIESTVAVLI